MVWCRASRLFAELTEVRSDELLSALGRHVIPGIESQAIGFQDRSQHEVSP